jgi:hypothetical protein
MFSIVFLLVSPHEFNLSIIYNEKPNKILGVLTQDDIWIKDSIKTLKNSIIVWKKTITMSVYHEKTFH